MAMGIKTTMGIDYDFIKTEEAKQIFIKLEKKRMLLEDYECGPNGRDYDLDNIFTFEDEEKKEMVERFLLRNKVISGCITDVEKYYKERYIMRKERAGEVYDKQAMEIVSKNLGHNRISVIAQSYLYN